MDRLVPKVGEPKVVAPKFELSSIIISPNHENPNNQSITASHNYDNDPTPKSSHTQMDGEGTTAHYHLEWTQPE